MQVTLKSAERYTRLRPRLLFMFAPRQQKRQFPGV